jgi:hypothetical protein
MQRFRVLFLVFLVALTAPLAAQAQPAPAPQGCAVQPPAADRPVEIALVVAYLKCVGMNEEVPSNALTKGVVGALKLQGEVSRTELQVLTRNALDQIAEAVRQATNNSQEPLRTELVKLANELATVRAGVGVMASPADVTAMNNGNWRWDTNNFRFGGVSVSLQPLFSACGTLGPACTAAFADGIAILRVAKLTERTLTYYNAPLIATALASATERDARWTSYFADTVPQYPWELVWNGANFTRAARKAQGFLGPPSHQLVFLHPDVAFEFLEAAEAGKRFKPAVALEAIGLNKWSWNEDNKPSHAVGVSFVLVWSDREETNRPGYGVLVRYATKYSVSLTRRHGGVAVAVSSNLSELLTGANEKLKSAMRFGVR